MKSIVVVALATNATTGAIDSSAPFLVMAKDLRRDGVYHDEAEVIAQFLPGESKARFYAEWTENGWKFGRRVLDVVRPMSDTQFELIDKRGKISGRLHLKYGAGMEDSLPFVLILTPAYVANDSGAQLPLTLQQIQEYADRNAEQLKAIARNARDQGLITQVLE